MPNFDVCIVYCCRCVLKLVEFQISRREVLSQVLIIDFIRACFNSSMLIELFKSLECVLITCTKRLVKCLYFDWKWCNHYNRTFFTTVYDDQTFRVSKRRSCYKLSLISILDNFLRIFC